MKHYALLRVLDLCLPLFVLTLLCEQGKEQRQLSGAKLFIDKKIYLFRSIATCFGL